MEASILSALERAERDAQDRRLEAEAEADRLLRDARERARAIEAAAGERARAAVDARRSDALAVARDEASGIDAADTGAGGPGGTTLSAPDRDDGRSARAVELVVAAVLGESDPTTGGSERGEPAGVAGPGRDSRGLEAVPC